MKRVAPSRRLRASVWRMRPAGSRTGREAPRKLCTAGRGRSVGSSREGGRPASCRRQKAISFSRVSPCSQERCHTAKSAYCTGSSGRSDGRPSAMAAYKAVTSRTRMPIDQPSLMMWCIVSAMAWSSSPSRSTRARSSGPRARLNERSASSSARAVAVRPLSGSPDRSTTGSPKGAAGWITCTGEPSCSAKTVRNVSWRRTISPRHRASTAASSGPSTRSAAGML